VGKQLVSVFETTCFQWQDKLFSMARQLVSGSPCQAISPFAPMFALPAGQFPLAQGAPRGVFRVFMYFFMPLFHHVI
jgi:hypothetical protein